MKLKFNVTFKSGTRTVAKIEGQQDIEASKLTVGEVVEQVQATEQFLEKLTGYRVHIEQVN
jgi:flagellar biosynthesis chaperone FliJ